MSNEIRINPAYKGLLDNQSFSKNVMGTDYIVGDIHGCYNQLVDALFEVSFDTSKDRLFSVGDLVDRGPNNLLCLRLIEESWFHCVVGNHEIFMIQCLLNGEYDSLWCINGGNWVRDLTETDKERATGLAKVASGLPVTITLHTESGVCGISHAEPPTRDWSDVYSGLSDDHIDKALWERNVCRYGDSSHKTDNIDITVHGHTPIGGARNVGNAVFIDTGSFLKERGHKGYKGVVVTPVEDLFKMVSGSK